MANASSFWTSSPCTFVSPVYPSIPASPAARTCVWMMRTASEIALSSDVNSPVAPGAPRIPAVIWASRVVPTLCGAGIGLIDSVMTATL